MQFRSLLDPETLIFYRVQTRAGDKNLESTHTRSIYNILEMNFFFEKFNIEWRMLSGI